MSVSLVMIFGFGLLIVALAVSGLIYTIVRSVKHTEAAGKIAAALRWTPVARGAAGQAVWYQGKAQGRETAVRAFARVKQVAIGGDGPRWRSSQRLQVAMEVAVRGPLGVDAQCLFGSPIPEGFESCFVGAGMERLHPEVRQALLQFAQAAVNGQGGGTARHIHLVDRAAIPPAELHPDVLRQARIVLLHENPNSLMDLQAVQKLFYDLATVAYTVERSVNGN